MSVLKTCIKAFLVISAVVVVPVLVWEYSRTAVKTASFAAAAGSFTFGEYRQIILNSGCDSQCGFKIISKKSETAAVSGRGFWDIDTAQQETEQHLQSGEIPSAQPSEKVLDAIKYPASMENHDGVIQSYTFGNYSGKQFFDLSAGGQVRNCTQLSNSYLYSQSSQALDFKLDKNSLQPQILIYHTHATESFEPYERNFYDKSFSCKTTDRTKNIVSVGDEICRQLDKSGIKYVHDTLVHDYPSYDGSYDSSRATVKEILKKYPSIKICLDIHRDGIQRSDGTRLAPVTEIDGKKAAQIMIISGCDDGTMGMPDYIKNFGFACKLQSQLESDNKGLTRPILFDYRFYNQDLTTGSLLIEVGSQANSLSQVQYSGKLIGKSLSRMF